MCITEQDSERTSAVGPQYVEGGENSDANSITEQFMHVYLFS